MKCINNSEFISSVITHKSFFYVYLWLIPIGIKELILAGCRVLNPSLPITGTKAMSVQFSQWFRLIMLEIH